MEFLNSFTLSDRNSSMKMNLSTRAAAISTFRRESMWWQNNRKIPKIHQPKLSPKKNWAKGKDLTPSTTIKGKFPKNSSSFSVSTLQRFKNFLTLPNTTFSTNQPVLTFRTNKWRTSLNSLAKRHLQQSLRMKSFGIYLMQFTWIFMTRTLKSIWRGRESLISLRSWAFWNKYFRVWLPCINSVLSIEISNLPTLWLKSCQMEL